jgi:hypothetical protein
MLEKHVSIGFAKVRIVILCGVQFETDKSLVMASAYSNAAYFAMDSFADNFPISNNDIVWNRW